MLRILAAAIFLSQLPAAAAVAQAPRQAIDEVAADLAYGFCPLFLADQFSLTDPELAARGFGGTVTRQQDPRLGEVSLVEARRPDGGLAFGGAPGKTCTVVVSGPKRQAALTKLREAMSLTGLAFEPTANLTPDVEGFRVETFKAAVDEQTLYVQLIEAGGPTPVVMAQLFVMES